MAGERFELSRSCLHEFLRLACLPFHHPAVKTSIFRLIFLQSRACILYDFGKVNSIMRKEIGIDVDVGHVRAFRAAIEGTPEIDFRNFSPHLALRCRLSDELVSGVAVRVSAAVNGGPLDIRINGAPVDGIGVTRESLESVVEVFCPGSSKKITDMMIKDGSVLILSGSS